MGQSDAMIEREQTYRERRPAAPLERHLTCVWVQHVGRDAPPYAHRTVPNGGVELLCELGSAPRVVGPQNHPTTEVLAPGATVVGVRFRPGAAPSALGLPASELVDLALDADELWGSAGAALGERLAQAGSPADAAALLEAEVFARLAGGAGPDPLVTEAVRRLTPGRADEVGTLSSSLHISERQLRRRCLTTVGLAPKVLQRMLRFQGFLALAHARGLERPDVGRLALDAGYADQAHLTRESRRLSGLAPRALLREAERNCRGSHDHSASYAPLLRAAYAA
jgi:AraC-like DNA-binding protein